ncbi:uncharacterized protein ARMOST_17246 [Armillaria ostoyae]|uniref:Uncharacterized protein n=1 Tax=Armillaria ostoyae TaxID=47428 RepID=A0A284RYG0_ARMOS|nr:uncharacterized protein ARMOST_17246 [Armillaria ostoyae]
MTLDYYSRNRHSLNDDRGYSSTRTGIRSVTRRAVKVFPTAVLSSESRIRYERGIDSLLASLHPSCVASGSTQHFYTEVTQAGFVKESNTPIEAFFSTTDRSAFRHSRLSTS